MSSKLNSVYTLVDELLTTDLFSCSHCKKLLQCPIMLTKHQGNVCSPCYANLSTDGPIIGLENYPLNMLLSKMELPCEYRANGCEERIIFPDLPQHTQCCIYQTIKCLTPSCSWTGCLFELASHFSDSHPEKTPTNENDNFKYPFSRQSDVRMFQSSHGTFMLCTIIEYCDEKAYFFLYDLDQLPGVQKRRVSILCLEQDVVKTQFDCETIKDIHSVINCDTSVSTERSLDSLNGIQEMNVVLAIEDGGMRMDENLLRNVECPVCNEYMRPQIFQCVSGHDVCSSCRSKIQNCPICRGGYNGTRNYTLETLVSHMKYPCLYRAQGCSVQALLSTNHEEVCRYRQWQCPVRDCIFRSRYAGLLAHVREEHADTCTVGDRFVANDDVKERLHRIATQPSDNPIKHTVHFVLHGLLFTVSFSGDSRICTWQADIIGLKQKGVNYRFYASFEAKDECDIKNAAVKGPCRYKDNRAAGNEDVVSMSTEIFRPVLGASDLLNYFVTIEKGKDD